LRDSEALNRSIVESSTDCVKVLDLDGNLLFMNGPGLCAMEIDDFQSVAGRPWASLWPDDTRPAVEAALATAKAGRPARFAAFCPTAKGKPRWWDVAVSSVRNHDEPVRLVSISRDVTAQHQAEQHLRDAMQRAEAAEHRARRAQTRLEEAIAALPEGFALYDSDDRLVVCNERTRELYPDIADLLRPGETYETMLRAFAARSVRFPSAEAAGTWIAERLAYHRAPVGAVEHQLSDGRWVRIEERRTKSGDTVGMRVDITALKERESTSKLLFESNPVPMWVCDRETLRILKANGSALEQYGYDRDSFLAMTVNDLRPADDVTFLHASLAAPEPPNGRYGVWRHRRADGTVFEVDVVSRRFHFRGRPAALVAAIDVTAQRRAEEALRLAKEEAEAASRTKSQFLANMSHELRTPLNAVIGFSEIIMNAVMGPVDGRYREYARDIHKSGQHLLGLIGDVLDLSKVEAGRLELYEGPVDVGRVIGACRRLVVDRANANGVQIEEAIAPDLPLLAADELRLKQIVLNLVSNAVKFTPAGGRVSVAASAADGGMTITVADTGIGMRAEDIPVALEPFRQVDDALNRRFQGTGLGLPLAKMLTELHGGALEIASEPNRGTVVRVRLPDSRVLQKVA
jgi:PAS domain S-box-containing protein